MAGGSSALQSPTGNGYKSPEPHVVYDYPWYAFLTICVSQQILQSLNEIWIVTIACSFMLQ
jgi:hypothetical protein